VERLLRGQLSGQWSHVGWRNSEHRLHLQPDRLLGRSLLAVAAPTVAGANSVAAWNPYYSYSITLSGTTPSGQIGDREFMFVRDSAEYYNAATPSGWTHTGLNAYSSIQYNYFGHCYWRTATTTAGTAWSWTSGGNYNASYHSAQAVIIRVSNTAAGSSFSNFASGTAWAGYSRWDMNSPSYGFSQVEDGLFMGMASISSGGVTRINNHAGTFVGGNSNYNANGVCGVDYYTATQQTQAGGYYAVGGGNQNNDWQGMIGVAVKGIPSVSGTAAVTASIALSAITGEGKPVGGGWGKVMI